MSNILTIIIKKSFDVIALEVLWFRNDNISIFSRIHYAFQKYICLLNGARKIRFLGSDFFYDNKITPFLLAMYPTEIQALLKNVTTKQAIQALDIGANLGQWARTLRYFEPNSNIVSFEPNIDIIPILKKNSSKYSKWKIFPYGISNHKKSQLFYYGVTSSEGGSFVHQTDQVNLKTISAQLIHLTSMTIKRLKIPKHYTIVKIDVEGMEEEVLLGLRHISYDVLSVEIDTGRGFGITVERILEIINTLQKRKMIYVGMVIAHQGSPEANAIFRRQ